MFLKRLLLPPPKLLPLASFSHALNGLLRIFASHFGLLNASTNLVLVGVNFVRTALVDVASSLRFASDPDSDQVTTSYGIVTMGSYGVQSAVVDAFSLSPNAKGFASNFGYEISKHRCYERELDELTSRVAY